MTIRRYKTSDRPRWNELVEYSVNGTFLFMREYMEYHADRFCDHSLVYCDERGVIIALLPANEVTLPDGTRQLHSHQGLTFGGWIYGRHFHMSQLMEACGLTVEYLKAEGFSSFFYKQPPSIYHRAPAEGDEYALWRHGAVIDHCLVSASHLFPTATEGGCYIPFDATRQRRWRKLRDTQGYLLRPGRLEEFWPIMEANLRDRYGVAPVHTLAEMEMLQKRFPENIVCYVAERQGEVTAGAVVYLSETVAHLQYAHSTPTGRKEGAIDFLYKELIEHPVVRGQRRYFDFGTSNEERGQYLNEALIAQKEGCGGRTIACRTYRIDIQ